MVEETGGLLGEVHGRVEQGAPSWVDGQAAKERGTCSGAAPFLPLWRGLPWKSAWRALLPGLLSLPSATQATVVVLPLSLRFVSCYPASR